MKAEKIISPNQYGFLQLLANVLFILIWFFSNEGLSFWDDFTYLNFAHEINQGVFEITTNHFTSRVGLIYPTAWVIDVLGTNEYSMVVFPLICGLGLINGFFFLGRRINYWIGLTGGLMIICDYHMINFAIHLFPELPLTLSIFIFFVGYYLILKKDADYRLTAFVCALTLFGAFLIKTTVFLLIPLIVFLFINDRIQKRNRGFWLIFVTLSALFFTLHGLWYLELKGSFMYRFQNIADNHVATVKTFFDKDNLLWKRLTYLPLLTFTKGGYFIPLLIALPSMILLKRKNFSLKDADHFWPVASLILILSYWFFSTNWRYYSPLPLETRHIAFFIPVFSMSAATFWPKHKWFVFMERKWVVVLVLLAFLSIPAYTISKSNNKRFAEEQEIIEAYFVFNKISQTIITDGLTSYGYPYFYGFTEVGDKYLWFSEMDLDEVRQGDFVLENRAYFNQEYNDDQNFGVLMSWISEKGWKLQLLEEKKGVKLYRIE
uniref:ArnT family glycosyltransferase n=1 Tax=Roseivirga sp. TaxID=1964215 RepID=UPI0040474598